MLDESSHGICQIMFIDLPYMRLLPAVSVSEVVKCNHLVTDVVKLSVQRVAPVNGVMRVSDFNPAAMLLDYICDVIE
jgi:hypothetical protein